MKVKSNKIGDIRSHYRQKLEKIYNEKEADSLLFILMTEYTGMTRAEILINSEQPINESQLLKIHFGVKALENQKPIQYITGTAEFFGLNFSVTPDVLIPRPETEELVDWVIKEQSGEQISNILDVGTGSGCIAIVLKQYFPDARVDAVDISEGALRVAANNSELHKTSVNYRKIDFLDQNNWELMNNYEIIVSNPPYVRNIEKGEMQLNVLNYEPDLALFVDDTKPLIFYQHIALFAKSHLLKKGLVYCEVNQYLADETCRVFENEGFRQTELRKDISGRPRFLKCSL